MGPFPSWPLLWISTLLLLVFKTNAAGGDLSRSAQNCAGVLSQTLVNEIGSYQPVAAQIRNAVLNGPFRGRSYRDLALFVDTFGSRFSGTANLEASIDYMLAKMRDDGLENVHGEQVLVPHWVREQESVQLLLPRRKKLAFLGAGGSVPTPLGGITAEVLVVNNFTELTQRAEEARGKIVVYNPVPYTSYAKVKLYNKIGADVAAKMGALAVLIRSPAPFSIYTPHAEHPGFDSTVTSKGIPSGCITIEDADFLRRCQDRSWRIVIRLKINSHNLPMTNSRNSVGEISGRTVADEMVLLGAHIDSWDVGDGALDDGGGAILSEEVLSLLTTLKLRPRRTLQATLWTGNEVGRCGQRGYVKAHQTELSRVSAYFDTDRGSQRPLGFDFVGVGGSNRAGCIVQEILKLLAPINATQFRAVTTTPLPGVENFVIEGVPGLGLNAETAQYYWSHHSEGESMTGEDPHELDLCLVALATTSYIIADLSAPLPRD